MMRDLTHQALIVLLDPDLGTVLDVYVGVGPTFAIGEIDQATGGLRLLLAEAKCTTIEQANRAIYQMAIKDYPWVLFDKEDKLRSAGSWVGSYEQHAKDMKLDDCVIWGKRW